MKDESIPKEMFEEEFSTKIKEGSENNNVHYFNMLYHFGDIYAGKKHYKREEFLKDIVHHKIYVSTLITGNMEALMCTILEVGCWNDWREYLESDKYKQWEAKCLEIPDNKKKPMKPVSGLCVNYFSLQHHLKNQMKTALLHSLHRL